MSGVQVQRVAPDVELETRLSDDGSVRHVAIVYVAARSQRDLVKAVERAREVFKDASEPINDVEIRIDDLAEQALLNAQKRRERRAAKWRAS